jgi:N-ethylmaleimide reductase
MSAIKAEGDIYTDSGMQEYSAPQALDAKGITRVIRDHVNAAESAIKAGFDGVVLHAAHGYLLEQSLNPNVNNRDDNYGGSIEKRSRLTLEIAEQIGQVIGADKIGVRISPYLATNGMSAYESETVHATYLHLATKLNRLGIAYLHISNNPDIPERTHKELRNTFDNTIIYCNGLTAETAEAKLQDGSADLVAFGRSFLANPDFIKRIEKNETLNELDYSTLYVEGGTGYTDYPTLN